MKRWLQGMALVWLIVPETLHGTTNAAVRFTCLSLRFQPATANAATLSLSTAASSAPANGELSPVFDPTLPNHGSGFFFTDPTLFGDTPASGTIFFDTPPFSDANSNGFDDFFEVSQAVPSTTTQGLFNLPVENGTVTAIWSRAAGSATGVCQLHLEGSTFGDLGTYTHGFQLLEYTGPLVYTPGSNTVNGTIGLTQTGTPANALTGAVALVKVATNRFNELVLQPGTWTNAAVQTLVYTNSLIQRDQFLGTNYYGFLAFADGDPATPDPDYTIWLISIDDPNDANHNGIPDFSDDPVLRRPGLTLAATGATLALRLSGDVGRTYQVQQTPALSPTNWTLVQSLTLTNDPQSIPLSRPGSGTSFWRVIAP